MLTLAALSMFAVATRADPPALPPVGKWVVNYAENMCVLSHDFGPAEAPVSVGFRPLPLSEQNEVVVIFPGESRGKTSGDARISLDPQAKPFTADFWQVPLPKQKRHATRLRFDADVTPLLAKATEMTVTLSASTTRFKLPPMKAALAALRACQDDLLHEWGIDPHERDLVPDDDPVARNAQGNPAEWIGFDDYPADALSSGRGGTVLMLWAIGTDGRARDCRIILSSGVPSLDEASCAAITKRARYRPALDRTGKPVVTHSSRRVVWRIPE